MSYSGLIYAAIVACWAAFLVPRWIRRNEEIERAREEDAARGVRVLERRRAQVRHGYGHPTLTDLDLRGPAGHSAPEEADEVRLNDDEARGGEEPEEHSDLPYVPSFGAAARRRRRVLLVLLFALVVVVLAVRADRLPTGSIAVPAVMLAGFLVLARRAAVAEARRRARMRRIMARRRAEAQAAAEAQRAASEAAASGKRVAILDEPEPVEPVDPNAWEPVPVPLPTYLTKDKAEPPVVRKIDLSSPGAWTSGRLNPAGSISLPPPRASEDDDDLPEQRRAVGR